MTVAAISETGRQGAVIRHVIVREMIEAGRRCARLHFRNEQIEHFGREPTGLAHAFEGLGPVKRYAKAGFAGGLKGLGCGNLGHGLI